MTFCKLSRCGVGTLARINSVSIITYFVTRSVSFICYIILVVLLNYFDFTFFIICSAAVLHQIAV